MHINTIAHTESIKNEVFIIMPALFLSPRPRSIEKRGAPPLPNKLLNAVIITMIGKHNPTAPSAAVPTSAILAI